MQDVVAVFGRPASNPGIILRRSHLLIGMAVLVACSGSVDSRPDALDLGSSKRTPQPTVGSVDPRKAFPKDTPYRFSHVPDTVAADFERELLDPELVEDVAIRKVTTREGRTIGLVIAWALSSKVATNEKVKQTLISGMIQVAERFERRRLGRTETVYLVLRQGGSDWHAIVWLPPQTNLMLWVYGESRADAEEIAKVMIDSEHVAALGDATGSQ